MPSHNGIWRDDGANFNEYLPTECLAEYGQSSSLVISKPDLLVSELLTEYSILLFEVIDHSLLLVIEDASNDDAEELPWIKSWSHGTEYGSDLNFSEYRPKE